MMYGRRVENVLAKRSKYIIIKWRGCARSMGGDDEPSGEDVAQDRRRIRKKEERRKTRRIRRNRNVSGMC